MLKLIGEGQTTLLYIYHSYKSVGSMHYVDKKLVIWQLGLEHKTSNFDMVLEVFEKPTFPKT